MKAPKAPKILKDLAPLLRACRARPRRRRAANERDEIAALHVWHGLPPAQE